MDITFLYIALVTGLVVLFVRWTISGSGKRPPGPTGLPLVGYLPFMSRDPHLDFQRLAEKYGDIFGLRLGTRNVLVLSDYQSVKDAFAKDSFMGRPPELLSDASQVTIDTGAFFDLPWREQRRFSLHMLRDLGLGKSKMEEKLEEEITELLEHFEQNADKPFCARDLLASSMSNNIGSLIFGKRFKYDDPIRKMMNEAVNANVTTLRQVGWLIFFPLIKKWMQFLGFGKSAHKAATKLNRYTQEEIEKHEKTLNPDNIRDFIDGYLLEMQKKKDPTFCKEVLEDLVIAFFGAGSETVRVSLEWLLLIVAVMPEARRRIQAEVDEVIGYNRLPTFLDQKSMPYTDAFIMELNRWRTIIPINILRLTLTDTEIKGYFISKNTLVIANLWAIHHNKNYWGDDTEEFRPERFLTEDGKSVKKMEHYIPFSIGKRACPGEPLAKVEVFLYFTSILQRFDVRLPGGSKPDFRGTVTAALQPTAQDIILTKRQ